MPYNTDKIRLLFALNQPRGEHSAGYYNHITGKHFNQRVDKTVGKPIDKLLPNFKPAPTNLLIGHTRAATVGARNYQNAHPFVYGNVCLAHNGTLTNLDLLLAKYSNLFPKGNFNRNNISVDSRIFPAYMDAAKDLKVLNDFDGAAALMWTVGNDGILHIFRNHERPLHYGYVEGTGGRAGMYISSEKLPLEIIGCKKIKEFEVHKLYRIQNGKFLDKKPSVITRSPIKPQQFDKAGTFHKTASDIKPGDSMLHAVCEWIANNPKNLDKVTYASGLKLITEKILNNGDGSSTIQYNFGGSDIVRTATLASRKLVSTSMRVCHEKGNLIICFMYDDKSITERLVINEQALYKDYLRDEGKQNGERKKESGSKSTIATPVQIDPEGNITFRLSPEEGQTEDAVVIDDEYGPTIDANAYAYINSGNQNDDDEDDEGEFIDPALEDTLDSFVKMKGDARDIRKQIQTLGLDGQVNIQKLLDIEEELGRVMSVLADEENMEHPGVQYVIGSGSDLDDLQEQYEKGLIST